MSMSRTWIRQPRKFCARCGNQLRHGAYEPSTLYGDGLVSGRIADGLVKLEALRSEAAALHLRRGNGSTRMIMRVLGIITARGGSKGIPRKNLASLLGKPLLAYTAEAALASKKLTRTVLSTDDAEIADDWKAMGTRCSVPSPRRIGERRHADDSRFAGCGAEARSHG